MARRIVLDIWATNANRTSLPSTGRFEQGWEGFPAVPSPKMQNYLDNLATESLDHISKNGIPEWIATETYPLNGYCLYLGIQYKSLQAANINKNPSSEPTWWEAKTDVDSSETVKGIIGLATQAETNTGTNDLKAITPLKYTQAHQTCKAWVEFDGGTGAIRDSYNVSGVVHNSAGNYTVSFTNNMSDTKYVVLVSGSKPVPVLVCPEYYTKAVGSIYIINELNSVFTPTDLALCSVAIFSTF